MSPWEYFVTWYCGVSLVILVVLLIAVFLTERSIRPKQCPTCSSPRRKAKFTVRYYLSDYIWHESLCEDYWHNRKRK